MNSNINKQEESRLYTIAAFLLGMLLTENLTSTEQNALGNWLMLVAQTLCSNGSYVFNNDWNEHLGGGHPEIRSMLNKMNVALDQVNKVINKM